MEARTEIELGQKQTCVKGGRMLVDFQTFLLKTPPNHSSCPWFSKSFVLCLTRTVNALVVALTLTRGLGCWNKHCRSMDVKCKVCQLDAEDVGTSWRCCTSAGQTLACFFPCKWRSPYCCHRKCIQASHLTACLWLGRTSPAHSWVPAPAVAVPLYSHYSNLPGDGSKEWCGTILEFATEQRPPTPKDFAKMEYGKQPISARKPICLGGSSTDPNEALTRWSLVDRWRVITPMIRCEDQGF